MVITLGKIANNSSGGEGCVTGDLNKDCSDVERAHLRSMYDPDAPFF